MRVEPGKQQRKKIALLIPAHNEEVMIQNTLMSAVHAGLSTQDIYLVDDASSDDTLFKAGAILPTTNILKVPHSGKAGAVESALEYFKISEKYEWVHIADADSLFARNYFKEYIKNLRPEYGAAVGFVQSLRGNWLCSYRAVSYTYGQHIIKRIQSWLGMITVMPGPVTSYRTDVLDKLDFKTGSLTEDFDLTLQIHRKKLGKIRYIPEAVNYTQDPNTLKDFSNQTLRWYRGFFQGVKRYHLGLKPHRVDLSALLQVGELVLYFIQLCIALSILIFARENIDYIWRFFIFDISIVTFIVIYAAMVTARPRLLLVVFYYHFLKSFELGLYIRSFVEVLVLGKFQKRKSVGWKVAGRRYKLSKEALADFA